MQSVTSHAFERIDLEHKEKSPAIRQANKPPDKVTSPLKEHKEQAKYTIQNKLRTNFENALTF